MSAVVIGDLRVNIEVRNSDCCSKGYIEVSIYDCFFKN